MALVRYGCPAGLRSSRIRVRNKSTDTHNDVSPSFNSRSRKMKHNLSKQKSQYCVSPKSLMTSLLHVLVLLRTLKLGAHRQVKISYVKIYFLKTGCVDHGIRNTLYSKELSKLSREHFEICAVVQGCNRMRQY